MGVSGERVLTENREISSCANPRMAFRFIKHFGADHRGRSKPRNPMFSATLICGTQALRNGSSGSKNFVLDRLLARRAVNLAVNEHLATGRGTLASDDFHQFALAVAGNSGDAQQSRLREPRGSRCVTAGTPLSLFAQRPLSSNASGPRSVHFFGHDLCLALAAHHHRRHVVGGQIFDLAAAGDLSPAQHRDVIAKSETPPEIYA